MIYMQIFEVFKKTATALYFCSAVKASRFMLEMSLSLHFSHLILAKHDSEELFILLQVT
jgi:hypothetical protein